MMIIRTLLIQGPAGPPGTVRGTPTVWNPGLIANGAFAKTTVTVTGAQVGLPCLTPAWTAVLPDGVITWAQCTAANTVAVYILNLSGSPQTIAQANVYCEALTQ